MTPELRAELEVMRDRLAELQKKLPKERSLDVHLKLGVILVGFWRLLG